MSRLEDGNGGSREEEEEDEEDEEKDKHDMSRDNFRIAYSKNRQTRCASLSSSKILSSQSRLAGIPLDSYVELNIDENCHAEVTARLARRPGAREPAHPRLFLRDGGLDTGNWAIINGYIKLLAPFDEATKLLKGRGKHGRYGVI
ncbi:hypothetical protein CFE70_007851 [Pyrenophora teres f. teres 0-1]